ncbi:SdrD B-like domain-containing protein, partial [Portibacter lacus]
MRKIAHATIAKTKNGPKPTLLSPTNLVFFALLFLTFLSTNLQAQTCDVGQYEANFDWDIARWKSGEPTIDYGFGSTNLNIDVSISGTTFSNNSPFRTNGFNQAGGINGNGVALRASADGGGTITYKLTFSEPVDNLQFSMYDIDYNDALVFTSDNGNPTLTPASGSPTFVHASPTVTGRGRSSDNDTNGTLNVLYPNPVSSVTVTFSRPGGGINSGLGDIKACVNDAPEIACTTGMTKLDWAAGAEGYPAGALSHTYEITNPNGGSIYTDISFSGDTEDLVPTNIGTNSPDETTRFSENYGGLGDGLSNLKIRMNGPSDAVRNRSSVKSSVVFNQPLEDVRFSVYDVDNSTSNPTEIDDRRDQVQIIGYANGIAINPTFEWPAVSPTNGGTGNTVTAHPLGLDDAQDGENDRTTFNVYFEQAIDSFTLQYNEEGYNDPSKPSPYDPTTRVIAITNILFCAPDQNASISDQLFIDNNNNGVYDAGIDDPIANVDVILTDAFGHKDTVTTDSNGQYIFDELPGGEFTVAVDANDVDFPADVTPSVDLDGIGSANTTTVILADDEVKTNVDFGYQGPGSIGDLLFVDIDNNGVFDPAVDSVIANVTVNLELANGNTISTTTDNNGLYLFDNLQLGDYTVTVDINDTDFPAGVANSIDPDEGNNNTSDVTLTSSAPNNLEQDFGYKGAGSIGDQLYVDLDNNGVFDPAIDEVIANVTVTLTLPTGETIATITDENGKYLFTDLAPGDYSVTVDTNDTDFPAGVANSIDPDGGDNNTSDLTLAANEANLAQDFGYKGAGSIGDQLFVDLDNNGEFDPAVDSVIANVTVTLNLPSGETIDTITDANGKYIFEDLAPGDYSVTVDTNDTDFPAGVANSIDPD